MFQVAVGHAQGLVTEHVTQNALEALLVQLNGNTPNAGVVFACPDFEHSLILQKILEIFPNIELMGCTTGGNLAPEIGCADDSISIMAFVSDTITIKSGLGKNITNAPERAVRHAMKEAAATHDESPSLCLTFADGNCGTVERLLYSLQKKAGDSCPILGGLAGSSIPEESKSVKIFHKHHTLQDALVVLNFYGPLDIGYRVSNSWLPVGQTQAVTEMDNKELKRIGNSNALNFFREYLGPHANPSLQFPFAIYENNSDSYYIRSPFGYDEEAGSIFLTEGIPPNSRIGLTEVTPQLVLENIVTAIQEIGYPRNSRPACGLILSCVTRRLILGTRSDTEVKLLKKNLPAGMPFCGFYSNGEICPLNHEEDSHTPVTKLHQSSMVVIMFGEKGVQHEYTHGFNHVGQGPVSNSKQDLQLEVQLLRKQLERSQALCRAMEDVRDMNRELLQNINRELEETTIELQKSEEKHRRILETCGEGFVLMDIDRKIQYANDAFCNMINFSCDELLGKSPLAFVPKETHRELFTIQRELKDQAQRKFEITITSKDGKNIPTMVHANTLHSSEGEPIGHVSFIMDLSELKEAENLKADMELIARHDLKTPLSGIINIPQIIRNNTTLTDEQTEYLDMIEESGYQMLDMINMSLSLYRMEQENYEFTPTPVDILRILKRVLLDTKPLITQKNISISFPGKEHLPQEIHIIGEELICYSMMANLLKNAVEASPEQKDITISITPGDETRITIHNHGAVPHEIRKDFFKKYSTFGKSTGTGLGTYSAHLMAKTMNGRIELETSQNTGTSITVTLPTAIPFQSG